MEYGIYSLLDSINKQYDDLRAPFLKCKTVKELRKALEPHVKRIVNKYEDCCYGSITATVDSFRYEIYELEKAVYHISPFGACTINRVMKEILSTINPVLRRYLLK